MRREPTFDLSLKLYHQARRLIPGGSQTNSKRADTSVLGQHPIFIQRAEGCRVWDVDGNEYIDYLNALGPIILGYRYPAVDNAIRERLKEGIIFGLPHPLEIECAQLIVDAVPCAEMVRFLKSGAEVTSAAARIARAYTGREKLLTYGYHGWHDNWTALRNDGGVPKVLEGYTIPFPYNDLPALERLFAEHRGEIAAVIMVPTQVEPPREGYLAAVRDLAWENGALLIYDEIVTGFRLARGGAQEYFGVVPDLACFAKALANGMPLACVCGRREVMEVAEELLITTTYGGEILSLAAAVACLREYQKKDVQGYLWRLGEQLMRGLNEAARRTGVAATCDGYPPLAQLNFRYQDPARNKECWRYFLAETAHRGVLTGRGRLWFITYSHREEDIKQTVAVCEEVFAEMSKASIGFPAGLRSPVLRLNSPP
ncbi:MAG TPA: aspartate aminotransferase family protein [Armatimonadetes bacterium]|nr:aspartate aminotransferase family protein [Armatimonadota bacterium]